MKRVLPGLKSFLACALALLGLAAVGAHTESAARAVSQRGGRLAPPSGLKCERDDTTSFTGRVLAYERTRNRIFLRVRTDEETTEEFTLRFAKDVDPKRYLLLRGERFAEKDWRMIEMRRGKLRPHVRVTVWACYRDDTPVAEILDWQPPSDDARGRGLGRP